MTTILLPSIHQFDQQSRILSEYCDTSYSNSSSSSSFKKTKGQSTIPSNLPETEGMGKSKRRYEENIKGTNILIRCNDETIITNPKKTRIESVLGKSSENSFDQASSICNLLFGSEELFTHHDFIDLDDIEETVSEEDTLQLSKVMNGILTVNNKDFFQTIKDMNAETLSRIFTTL